MRTSGCLPDECDLSLELVRHEEVVGIETGNPFTPGFLETEISRSGNPPIGLGQNADAGIAPGTAIHDRAAAVRRAVVDDQELEIPKRLGQDTFDGLRQVSFPVMNGNDDGYLHMGSLCLSRLFPR